MSDTPVPNATGGNSSARGKAAKRTEIADRRRRVAALALARMSLVEIQAALIDQIGIRVGLSTLSRDMMRLRAEWRDEQRVSIASAQEQELAALAKDEGRIRGFLMRLPAESHKDRVSYHEVLLKIQVLRAKILGTEAPQKIESRVDATVTDRRTALSTLCEGDRLQLAALAVKAYGPRATVAAAIASTNGNGNGSAPHN